jgi:hypothetical protein
VVECGMPRPRFQFRLWPIFALTALVGWGIVALPYWYETIHDGYFHWKWERGREEREKQIIEEWGTLHPYHAEPTIDQTG